MAALRPSSGGGARERPRSGVIPYDRSRHADDGEWGMVRGYSELCYLAGRMMRGESAGEQQALAAISAARRARWCAARNLTPLPGDHTLIHPGRRSGGLADHAPGPLFTGVAQPDQPRTAFRRCDRPDAPRRAQVSGLDAERITAHSLRAGHATAAALAGVRLDRSPARPGTATSRCWSPATARRRRKHAPPTGSGGADLRRSHLKQVELAARQEQSSA